MWGSFVLCVFEKPTFLIVLLDDVIFQGQERRVIIISCVRSSQEYIDSDKRCNLGFLVNPKRFNVAITRAQALLIIVGNPKVLWEGNHWQSLIRYCKEKGAYTGAPFELPSESDSESESGNRPGDAPGLVDAMLAQDDSDSSDDDRDIHESGSYVRHDE